MIEEISKNLVNLKQEFRRTYSGTSHIQEIIPLSNSDDFPIDFCALLECTVGVF